MSEVLGETITYDPDPETFKRVNIGALRAYFGEQGDAMMDFWLR
jgi:hypothetical protein